MTEPRYVMARRLFRNFLVDTTSDRLIAPIDCVDDGQRVCDLLNAGEHDRQALIAAYMALRRWHDSAHSPNRPPYLNCTNCHLWPIIADMAAALGFDPLNPPREMRP